MDQGKKTKKTESVDVALPNAVQGKVVLRFGEPSEFRGLQPNSLQLLSHQDTCTLDTSRLLS
jgi:hypothetical protein